MFRFFIRFAAVLILASAFAALVIDGTRSIAGRGMSVTPLSDLIKSRLPALEQTVGHNIHPLLWDPVLTGLLRLPAWLVLAMGGLLLLWAAQRRTTALGRSARS